MMKECEEVLLFLREGGLLEEVLRIEHAARLEQGVALFVSQRFVSDLNDFEKISHFPFQ